MTRTAYVVALMAKAWTLSSAVMGRTPEPVADAIQIANTEKPLFIGVDGWRLGSSLFVGIARWESGFLADAMGDCKGKKPGEPTCGKDGSVPDSWCFMQINLPNGAKTAEGWTGPELNADPLKCARAAREIIRCSIKGSPAGVPLLQYAGRASAAKLRMQLAHDVFSAVPWGGDT